MTTRKNLVATIHDAIDTVTTTVENVHKQVADVPLEVLGEITSLTDTLDEVRAAQARSIAAVYGSRMNSWSRMFCIAASSSCFSSIRSLKNAMSASQSFSTPP